jgi:hypothetical protein
MLTERRALQFAIALAACVPVGAGLGGVLLGPALTPGEPFGPSTDSHYRYLSGLLLGIGLIVVIGGLARLLGLILADALPSLPMRLALVMELVVTPALVLWQSRVSSRHKQPLLHK